MIPWRMALIFSLGEQLVEGVLAEHRAQRGLRDLRGGDHEVLELHDRRFRVDDPEVGDGVDTRRNVVLRDHFLGRDVECDRAQVDLDDPVDDRNQERDAWAFRFEEAPEAEDHAALVLTEDSEEEHALSFQ